MTLRPASALLVCVAFLDCTQPTDDTCEGATCPAGSHCELLSDSGSESGPGAVATCVPDAQCGLGTSASFDCPAGMTCADVVAAAKSTKACVPDAGSAQTCTDLAGKC